MKKLIFIVLALVALFSATTTIVADDVPTSATNGTYYLDFTLADTICTGLVMNTDTLIGADSITLKTHWKPERGFDYFYAYSALSGASVDTADVYIRMDCFDKSKNKLYSVFVDTLTTTGGVHFIPLNTRAFGHTFTLKAVNFTGASTKVILNRQYLYRRSILTRGKEANSVIY